MKWTKDLFVNEHGWVDFQRINHFLTRNGYSIHILDRHNRTDGEIHCMYINKTTKKSYEFNGNYWSQESFIELFD